MNEREKLIDIVTKKIVAILYNECPDGTVILDVLDEVNENV